MIRIFEKYKSGILLICILSLMVILYSFAMFQGGFVSYFLLYSIMPILALSLYTYLIPLKMMGVEVNVHHDHFQIDKKIVIKAEVVLPLPLLLSWIHLSVKKPIKFSESIDSFAFPLFKRKIQHTFSLDSVQRGEHYFESIKIEVGDVFGFFNKEHIIPIQEKVLVYPTYVKIPIRKDHSALSFGTVASTSNVHDQEVVVGNREYQKGDRFSWIDWKATARRQELITKEFSDGKEEDLSIILDGTKAKMFDGCVSTAMSLVVEAYSLHIPYSLTTLGQEVTSITQTGNEFPEQKMKVWKHLSIVESNDEHSFSHIIDSINMSLLQSRYVHVITSNITSEFLHKVSLWSRVKVVTIYFVTSRDIVDYSDDLKKLQNLISKNIRIVHVQFENNKIFTVKENVE